MGLQSTTLSSGSFLSFFWKDGKSVLSLPSKFDILLSPSVYTALIRLITPYTILMSLVTYVCVRKCAVWLYMCEPDCRFEFEDCNLHVMKIR